MDCVCNIPLCLQWLCKHIEVCILHHESPELQLQCEAAAENGNIRLTSLQSTPVWCGPGLWAVLQCSGWGHFLMLCQQSGTPSLMKSGHLTPCHPSNHHLKLIFFSSPTDCDCVGEWGGGRGQGEREWEGERVRELVVYHKVWEFFSTYFVSCNGSCTLKEKWLRKEYTVILLTVHLAYPSVSRGWFWC